MSTSVVLIAYHGDRWLPGCLETLADASVNPLHLVLVDNAGNTTIDDLDLSAFNAGVLSTPRPMGFAEANNFALVEASHLEDTVLFLNQDTKSPPGWIDECVRVLRENPSYGAVSPCIRTYEDDGWDPSFLTCLSGQQKARLERDSLSSEVIPVQNAPAPALCVRTNVLADTGPFDPVYGSYYEDYDLCRRIRDEGHSIGFCRGARVCHFAGGSTTTEEQERRRMRQVIRNRVLYKLRDGDGPRWWTAVRRFLLDFPYRLARGVAGTSSSQPPLVTLKAYGDLLRIFGRLVSERHDEGEWMAYLDEIGWPPRPVPSSVSSRASVSAQ
ncbi:glycosyltransferase family 2 protein [Salinibacter sp.]|uniref:glycosyltransferase family 2 protein n=1 Tax=Salinibacter sp. TaxID=2065818 RepID=UPI0021E79002|nr:glycosyltransferase family 2 protein [Salinibacter sp.]